jgi:hypothetical protein
MSQEIIGTGRVPRLLLPDRGLEKYYPVNIVTHNGKGKSYRIPLLLIPSVSAPELSPEVRAQRTNYEHTYEAPDFLEILSPEMPSTVESIPRETDEMNISYFKLDETINSVEFQEIDIIPTGGPTGNGHASRYDDSTTCGVSHFQEYPALILTQRFIPIFLVKQLIVTMLKYS